MRGLLLVGTVIALVPLVLDHLLPALQGPEQPWSGELLHHRSERQLLRQSGRDPQRDPRDARDRRRWPRLISIPIGIGVALYLTEYGKDSRFANVVRYFVDVMTGVPSIVFGLFIYIVLVSRHAGGSGFAGWKGAVALSLLMLPIVIRSAEVVLLLVPEQPARGGAGARRAALAGGLAGGAADGARRAWSRARCWPSPAGWARPRRCCSRSSAAFGADRQPQHPDEHPARADLQRHHSRPRQCVVARAWGAALTLVALCPDPQLDRASGLAKEPRGMIPPDTTTQGNDRQMIRRGADRP